MNTLIIANLILWLSVFTVFMPASADKQASIDDRVLIEHKEHISQ